jgi:hypothetical protein
MPSSETWLAITSAILGWTASFIVPRAIEWIRRRGLLRDNLNIRLASGQVISVNATDRELNAVLRDAINAADNAAKASELASRELTISQATMLLLNREYRDAPKTIEELIKASNAHPTDRRVVITLGRLLAQSSSQSNRVTGLERAVDMLSKFVEIKKTKSEFDRDYADVLYNLACYKAQLSIASDIDPERQRAYREQAIQDLQTSVNVSPDNAAAASGDPDFDALRNDPSFIRIVN